MSKSLRTKTNAPRIARSEGASHARANAPARKAKAAAPSQVSTETQVEAPNLLDIEEPAPAKPAAPDVKLLKADSDDHLSTYFRDLAEHDLLGPEQERELSQGIEDQEIMTWERVLGHPDIAVRAIEVISDQLEQPITFENLLKAAEAARPKRKDTRT